MVTSYFGLANPLLGDGLVGRILEVTMNNIYCLKIV